MVLLEPYDGPLLPAYLGGFVSVSSKSLKGASRVSTEVETSVRGVVKSTEACRFRVAVIG